MSQGPIAVPYDEELLARSWDWLGDPEIRALIRAPVITREQQRAWFDKLPTRTDYVIWGIKVGGVPVGTFGIKNLTAETGEYWGYIGERSYWRRGIGRWMIDESVREAQRRGLRSLYLLVWSENTAAIRLYEATGFAVVSREADTLRMERPIHVA